MSGREGNKIQSPIVIREDMGVDATGIWGEGVCAIHGEICLLVPEFWDYHRREVVR